MEVKTSNPQTLPCLLLSYFWLGWVYHEHPWYFWH